MKRLKFNVGNDLKKSKCLKLHIGKNSNDCLPLFIRDKQLQHVTEITYLGDIVNGNGRNINNIKNRVCKARGLINDVFSILDKVCFGPHYFRVALLLRKTIIISSVLYNSDVWYNLSSEEISELNKVDKVFFTRLFKVPVSATFIAFFLETGDMELEMYMKSKRVIYFHNLVNRPKNQTIFSYFMVQYYKRSPCYWITTTLQDFTDIELDSSFQFLENTSILRFKKMVNEKIRKYAFHSLLTRKYGKSKLKNLTYNKLEIQSYLTQDNLTVMDKINIFKWRTLMVEGFGENFRGGRGTIFCPLCHKHPDSQEETFNNCLYIRNLFGVEGNYRDIFVETQIPENLNKTISRITRTRKK